MSNKFAIDTRCAPDLYFGMKFRELEKIILKDGWRLKNTEGSHYNYVHASEPGKVTIPCHGSKDIALPFVYTILKQAGLR